MSIKVLSIEKCDVIRLIMHTINSHLWLRKIIMALSFLVIYQNAYLQTPTSQSPLTQDQMLSSMASSASAQESEAPVSFFNYLNQGAKIDVRDMKSKYPNLKVEDFVEVTLPDLSEFTEVYNMMGVIDPKSKNPALIIWILGNPNAEAVSFFIDKDNDRNYLNDDKAIQVYRERAPIKTLIYPFGKENRGVEMNVQLPKNEKTQLDRLLKKLKGYSKNKIDNNFVLGLNVGVGVSQIRHSYTLIETGYPGWYETSLNEKNISLTAEKYFRYFTFGGRATYQHIYQYASYFNVRVGEVEKTGLNVLTYNNRDDHSNHRVKSGLTAGMRIHLGEYFEVIPRFSTGYIFYLNEKYVSNKFTDPQEIFEHKKDGFYEISLNTEFTSKDQNSFIFGFSYTNTDWAPAGFFESIDGRNLRESHQTYAFFAGYKFGL